MSTSGRVPSRRPPASGDACGSTDERDALVETYVTVVGNLVADPKMRSVATGQTVADIRIASNPRRFDREAGEFKDGDPIYIGVSCWRGLGLNVHASLRKGDSVVVTGRLQYREYDDKDGIHRNVYSIDAVAIGPDLARRPVDVRRESRSSETEPVPAHDPPQAEAAANSVAA